MSYQKNSTSKYRNAGGINQKISEYTTPDPQVLDLRNLDFYIPNAWTKVPGTTFALASGLGISNSITSIWEYKKLGGASYLLVGSRASIGPSGTSGSALYVRNTGTNTLDQIFYGGGSNRPFDILTFVDRAWFGNGTNAGSYNGTSTYFFGLPAQSDGVTVSYNTGVTGPFSVFGFTTDIPTFPVNTALRAIAFMGLRAVRNDGYYGPMTIVEDGRAITPFQEFGLGATLWSGSTAGNYGQNVTLVINLKNAFSTTIGITALAVYIGIDYFTNSPAIARSSDVASTRWLVKEDVDTSLFKFFTLIPAATQTLIISGAANYSSWAGTAFSGMVFDYFLRNKPSYIEVSNNRFFGAGFTALGATNAASTVWISNIGEPEVYEEENFFEYRTDDGQRITGIKAYQNQLIVFKQQSFAKLIGTDPSNFELIDLSNQYGCVSNRCIVEYDNILLFLDEKGIVRFDGANWYIISTPIEDSIRQIDIETAAITACGVHYPDRRQVWFSVPLLTQNQGRNSLVIIYDYDLNAWTFRDDFAMTALTQAKQGLPQSSIWMGYGGYEGGNFDATIRYVGQSIPLLANCSVTTAFDAPDGQDVENMFRRLYLDVNPLSSGQTGVINVDILSNYNLSTIQATTAIYQNQFQTRVDFGVMARSIGFRFRYSNQTTPLTIYGYDVQRRFLRKV